MKIAIIGAGNMGGATAAGFVRCGAVSPADLTVTARHAKSLARFAAMGINTSLDNVAAVSGADIVFYAVKPWLMPEVCLQTAAEVKSGRRIVVSIAPGVGADQLLSWFGADVPVMYAIPNTAVEIGGSMTYVAPVNASAADVRKVKALFDKVGVCRVVDASLMLAGTSLASCGIAYAMRYISAAVKGGEALGLDRKSALEAVCQTVVGAASLISEHKSDPEKEIDKVTTPGGLTLRGLSAMERGGFSKAVIAGLNAVKGKKLRLVVKVGSNVLTRGDGALDTTRVSSLVDQIVSLRRAGNEIVLVSSGAVACGRSVIPQDSKLDDVQQRQLYSSLGQVKLMNMYDKLFGDYGINVGQILTMKKNFSGRRECANQLGCMEVMLKSGVLPIVNENDTVSITGLMFTDNDELSGLVAQMIRADVLVILSNVDGVFDGDPGDPGSKVIPVVRPEDVLDGCIVNTRSRGGRGGMTSKCGVATKTAAAGIKVIIANGTRDNILLDVLENPENTVHTEFLPKCL